MPALNHPATFDHIGMISVRIGQHQSQVDLIELPVNHPDLHMHRQLNLPPPPVRPLVHSGKLGRFPPRPAAPAKTREASPVRLTSHADSSNAGQEKILCYDADLMSRGHVRVTRLTQRLLPDARRTITRFLWPGTEQRARAIVERVEGLSDAQVGHLVSTTLLDFGHRHLDIRDVLTAHFEQASQRAKLSTDPGDDRRLLIGAYFTMEYAYASAALFNPSMVPALRQPAADGDTRFIMSLRAVGEGHISSVVFRTGSIDADCNLTFQPLTDRTTRLRTVKDRGFEKPRFLRKLIEVGAYSEPVGRILDRLGPSQHLVRCGEGQRRSATQDPVRCGIW